MNHFPTILTSASPSDTERAACELAQALESNSALPRFIALYGDLGVGKTAFVRGFVGSFDKSISVKSPTFALVHEYRTAHFPIFHFDMYRITDDDDLYSTGYYDYPKRGGFILTEWSENIPYALPDEYIRVTIAKVSPQNPDERTITVEHIKP